eukprot:6486960-Amphidinium_carterae.1
MEHEPLMHQFETNAFARAFFVACKRVKQLCGTSACVALCRLFLGGVAMHSKHLHDGGCCLCMQWHTGGIPAIVARGCFRRPLSAFRSLEWLASEPPQVLPVLVVRSVSLMSDAEFRRLGRLSRILVEIIHTCRHQHVGVELHLAAIRNLAARCRRGMKSHRANL